MTHYWHAPNFDPVLIHLGGPFQIRWYSLLYVGGFIVGRFIAVRLSREDRFKLTKEDAEDLPLPLLLGAVIGARIFYCLFYDLPGFLSDPFYFFKVYNGGLSFHGGLVGVMVGGAWFCRRRKIPFLNMLDVIAICGTPGLAMGRLGNFINGELWGRVTDVPWALIFARGGPQPRHPSQLYELLLEGVGLFLLLWFLRHRLKHDGQIAITFLLGYPVARFIVEFFREPDAQLGYLTLGLTMGQWLCVAMFVLSAIGGWIIHWQHKVPRNTERPSAVSKWKKSMMQK
jgi:phosphatidylglycerol:prolipoprotein diacylglycerol transferase